MIAGYTVSEYEDKQIYKSGNLYFFIKDGKVVSKGYGSVKELVNGEQAKKLPVDNERRDDAEKAGTEAETELAVEPTAEETKEATKEPTKKTTRKKKSKK